MEVRQSWIKARGSSRSIDAPPQSHSGTLLRSHAVNAICLRTSRIVASGHPQPLRRLARQSEEDCGKRPERIRQARRFAIAIEQAYRRFNGIGSERGAHAASESKIPYTNFRPAQQPNHDAAERPGAAGNAFYDGCQRQQDDGKAPKRLVVFPVRRIPVHHRALLYCAATISRDICPCQGKYSDRWKIGVKGQAPHAFLSIFFMNAFNSFGSIRTMCFSSG
jgi:hypothetical protein